MKVTNTYFSRPNHLLSKAKSILSRFWFVDYEDSIKLRNWTEKKYQIPLCVLWSGKLQENFWLFPVFHFVFTLIAGIKSDFIYFDKKCFLRWQFLLARLKKNIYLYIVNYEYKNIILLSREVLKNSVKSFIYVSLIFHRPCRIVVTARIVRRGFNKLQFSKVLRKFKFMYIWRGAPKFVERSVIFHHFNAHHCACLLGAKLKRRSSKPHNF